MPEWRIIGLGLAFYCSLAGAAAAQDLTGVNGGVNSDNGAISGPNINRVNGINANGTPRQQDAGASMTNGAGNSTMDPGVTGGPGSPGSNVLPAPVLAPNVITHGTVAPTGPSSP